MPSAIIEFHRQLAAGMRRNDRPPSSRAEWEQRRTELRAAMRRAALAALEPARTPPPATILGSVDAAGARIERLTFLSRPGVAVTANCYLPATGSPPYPAVLCVHGHWSQARVDPVVQARCLGLCRLGYVVLAVDAFGAGERGTVPGVAEYHGGLLGASLWPTGTPLWGLQLHDNIRALDYLCSRPEVDRERIGCTGASGGGNQTMYISAFDDRIRAAAPVCSVGNFQAYLGRGCCVDEVMIGGLVAGEEGDLLGLVAPRALLVINASRDAPQFSPVEAEKSIARARPIFEVCGAGDRLRHLVIESGHDYNRPMREAVYGWFERWLRGRGGGEPVAEPPGGLLDPAVLKCFPGGERPSSVVPIVSFARERAKERIAAISLPKKRRGFTRWQDSTLSQLRGVLGVGSLPSRPPPEPGPQTAALVPEPGIRLDALLTRCTREGRSPAVVLLHPDGRAAAEKLPVATSLLNRGCHVLTLDLRGTGAGFDASLGLRELPDHTLVEAALWVGRPLMGQWIVDVRAAVEFLRTQRDVDPDAISLAGWREGGLLAILAAALGTGIHSVAAVECLASYVTEGAFHDQRMVVMVPDLLRCGDVPHLAALAAPRPVRLLNPAGGDGAPVQQADLDRLFRWTLEAYRLAGRRAAFVARAGVNTTEARELFAQPDD